MNQDRSPEPDVAAILAALRAEVLARRQALAATDDPERTALDRELQQCLEQIEITRVVSAHWPLEARSLVGRAGTLVNKVVRRYLRWYINPIVEQQNAFNDVVARTLRLLTAAHADLHTQLAELERDPPGGAPPAPATGGSDVQASDLQAQVAARGRDEPPAALADLALAGVPRQLAARQAVAAHWPIAGQGSAGTLLALLQRGTRQYLRWLINPIVDQQNAANAALTAASGPLIAADANLRARLAALRARRAGRRPGSQ